MNDRWDNHFIGLALHIARMSKDPETQVGAVIVGPDREIRSTGFNGFPRGIEDNAYRLEDRDRKLKLMVHAEMNAILNAARVGTPLKGCTLYLGCTDGPGHVWGGPPCGRCAVEVIQSGIVETVALPFKIGASKWRQSIEEARRLLEEAGIKHREIHNYNNWSSI